MFKECLLIPCALLSGVRNIQPRYVAPSPTNYSNTSQYVKGIYNLYDVYDLTYLHSYWSDNNFPYTYSGSFRVDKFPTSGMPLYNFSCPISIDNTTYFVEQFTFSYTIGNDIDVSIDYYYLQEQTQTLSFSIETHDSLVNHGVNLHECLFSLRNGTAVDLPLALLFNAVFTTQNNEYMTTYKGYYTWVPRSSYSNPFTAFGTELYSGAMLQNLYTYHVNAPTYDTLVLNRADYDNDDLVNYVNYRYTDVVFDTKLENQDTQFLVDWKLSKKSYDRLSTYGIFAYVRDNTYDDADFQDLLFSIMDSPFYMISRMLNWQLFGVNLFVALTGLLTVAVILVLIRKFW